MHPGEHGPQVSTGPPPDQPARHGPAASGRVPPLQPRCAIIRQQSVSGQQSAGVSLAITHQCCPNQPNPLTQALGRELVQLHSALKHQTLAVITAVRGKCAVVSSGLSGPAPRSCPHPEEEHTSNTLSQAMGDQLRSPHWWLLEGQWHRGMRQASGWDRKAT